MHDRPHPSPVQAIRAHLHRFVHWTRRRRRAALGLVLRGICYGLGTALVSTAAVWVQHLF
ncbi:hypothetical protein ACIP98_40435 [Streptomyces sp. NPDC088354]|uniref:hypothetical protein n=1 Tax=Streptomyces sp. NPDC088354 TaxID=3365856 RepID=UPI0037F83361